MRLLLGGLADPAAELAAARRRVARIGGIFKGGVVEAVYAYIDRYLVFDEGCFRPKAALHGGQLMTYLNYVNSMQM